MKKQQLIMILFVLFCTNIQAQYSSVELTGGYVPDGYQGNFAWNLTDNDNYFKVGISFSSAISTTKQNYKIPYSSFSLNGGYLVSLFTTNRQSFKIATGGGFLVGYEVINNGVQELSDGALIISKNKFIYGGFLTLENELALSRSFYILAKGDIYYHQNSDLGNLTFYSGIGARLYF